jgi:hypothetical protein
MFKNARRDTEVLSVYLWQGPRPICPPGDPVTTHHNSMKKNLKKKIIFNMDTCKIVLQEASDQVQAFLFLVLKDILLVILGSCTAKNQYRKLKQIFPEKELCGHSPNFHIHVSVSDLYIPTIDLPILLQEVCGQILGIYKPLTDI